MSDGYVDTLWYNCIANIFVQKEYNVIIVVSNTGPSTEQQ